MNNHSTIFYGRRRAGGVFSRLFVGAGVFLSALLIASGGFSAEVEADVDAVTSASVDAETGASKQLEAIKVTDKFSVAYAINDDGAVFIVAADLTDAYRRDELASDSIFKDKAMIIKGEVEKTSKPDTAKPWVSLVGDAESGKKVRCALKKDQLAGRNVGPGDIVQVRGVCDGMKLSVSVREGEILD